MTDVTASKPLVSRKSIALRWAPYALPAILVLFILVFSVLVPDIFPTLRTLKTLLRTESVAAILAIALIFPLIVSEFDVSIAAVLGLSAILVTGLPSLQGLPLPVAVLISISVCGLIGFINGVMIVRIGISALVATLGSSVIVTGMVFWYTNGNVIYNDIPPQLFLLAQTDVFGVPAPAVFLIVVAVAAWYVLELTPLGRYLYAIGGSKPAAELAGVNVKGLTILAFVIAGVLAGLAGILQAAQLGSGNPSVGPPFLLPAFASAFLGATAIKINRFNVLGTVVAVFTVAVGITGLQLLGMPFYAAPIFQGAALIIAVSASIYLKRRAA
ncbi:ABC transporter permease [Agrobacterium larrymoorei]|uniref:ABC transporter permease n=1 Tax=Agrobacterium larrymoorei TaxID=160699 RepID=A0AAF0HDZ1_9HYPH|nr:ABC transporter permease [Agrobacterium larrymoorei]WHA42606.1 ABC transporter permease [Agrobacterium larrymoorei]